MPDDPKSFEGVDKKIKRFGQRVWNWGKNLGEESPEDTAKRDNLNAQGSASNQFANTSEGNLQGLGIEAFEQRRALQRRALGQDSLSAEQLRQGLQQGLASQRSMAAGASPANAAMAAREAAMNMGRLSTGLSGQTAMAGIQERSAAEKQLSDMIMGQRQQELQGALGARQNATSAYSGGPGGKTDLEKAQPGINAGIGFLGSLLSDERLKTEIKDGDAKAASILRGLQAHSYRYKDQANGAGNQLGVTAQNLERAGLRQAVVDTPRGKMIDAPKLTGANTAMIASLANRLGKVEADRGRPQISSSALEEALRRRNRTAGAAR